VTSSIIIIIIIILVIVIIILTYMQGIFNYKPETNHVSRIYSVPAVLYLKCVPHVMLFHPYVLYLYISTFRSMCAVPNMAAAFL
jgi:hypothetical protein